MTAELTSSDPLPPDPEAARRVVAELAVHAGGVGTFDWDLGCRLLHWDEQLGELHGLDPSRGAGPIEDFYDRLHPADRDRVAGLLERAAEARGSFDAEYRVLLPNGAVRWVASRGRVFCGESGSPAHLVGAAYDTTAHREGDALLARILDAMSTAFFALDRHWRFRYVNAEAARVLGRSPEELVGHVLWERFPAAVGSVFETSYRHAAATGEPVAFDAYYPEPLNAWYEVRAWPHPEGLAVSFLDVTDRRRASEEADQAMGRMGLLAKVSEELVTTLDPDVAMRRLARLTVPALADWCIVTLVDDDEHAGSRRGLHRAVAWHAEPGRRPAAQRYASLRLEEMVDDGIVARAVEAGEPFVIESGATAQIQSVFPEASFSRHLVAELAPDALAVLPLAGTERPVGVLSLCNGAPRGAFSEDDLALARDIAGRAGSALERARVYRRQRDVAEGLQRSLLTAPPRTENLEIAVRYVPAAETAQVGGDWYDAFVQPDGSVVVTIGDVVGHALPAAAAMGQLRTLTRGIAALRGSGPAEVLADLETVMTTLDVATTATAIVGQIHPPAARPGSPHLFQWSNAGHLPPLRVDPDGAVRALGDGPADLLLGVLPGVARRQHQALLAPGTTVVFFTDGLVERRRQSLEAGVGRLQSLLAGLARWDVEGLCDEILRQLLPEQPEDDIALLVLRVRS